MLDRDNITTDPKHPGAALVGRKIGYLGSSPKTGTIVGTLDVPFDTLQGDLPRVWVRWDNSIFQQPMPETIKAIERFLIAPYPHKGGCACCRETRLCNVCGHALERGKTCTNGRCPTCHRHVCTDGGNTKPGHGYGGK